MGRKQPDTLYAFYDLSVAPATFDVTKFLILAELERRNASCSSIHVVFVPGPEEGFQRGELEIYRKKGAEDWSVDSLRWRLRNVLVPCCWQLPSCREVTVCDSREEAQVLQSLAKHVFPRSYTVRSPKALYDMRYIVAATSDGTTLPTFEATPQARRFVNKWIQMKAGTRKVITVTLRECPYHDTINTSLNDWIEFARGLDKSVYCPVFIRDTEVAFDSRAAELDDFLVFSEASWNLELRVALYGLSYLNMSAVGGTSILNWFVRKARSVTFMLEKSKSLGEWWRFRMNLMPGSQYACLGPFHRIVWEDDRLRNIQREFRSMCGEIENTKEKVFNLNEK